MYLLEHITQITLETLPHISNCQLNPLYMTSNPFWDCAVYILAVYFVRNTPKIYLSSQVTAGLNI